MQKSYLDAREHISIIKKIDSYMQHKLSDWEFKELVRTLAIGLDFIHDPEFFMVAMAGDDDARIKLPEFID